MATKVCKYISFLIILCTLLLNGLLCQETNPNAKYQAIMPDKVFSLGLYTNYNIFNTQYSFNSLPDIPRPSIPLTKYSNPNSQSFGFTFNYYTSEHQFIKINLGLLDYKINFLDYETVPIAVNGKLVQGLIEDKLNTEIKYLDLSLAYGINLISFFDVYLGIGIGKSISSNFEQTEKLIQPSGYDFVNPVGNYSGKIPNLASVNLTGNCGISINTKYLEYKNFRLIPGINFSFMFNNIVSGLNWKTSIVSPNISLVYYFRKEPLAFGIRDTIYARDTILYFSKKVTSPKVNRLARYESVETFLGEEVPRYLYTITEKYELIRPKPKSVINAELTTAFLTKTLEIAPSMEITYFLENINLYYPELNKVQPHIYSDKYTKVKKTLNTLELPDIRFFPQVLSESGVDRWELNISIDKKNVKTFSGRGDPPSSIDLSLDEILDIQKLQNKSINYKFTFLDLEGEKSQPNTGEIIVKDNKRSKNINKTVIIIPNSTVNLKSVADILKSDKSSKTPMLYIFKDKQKDIQYIDALRGSLNINQISLLRDDIVNKYVPEGFPNNSYSIVIIE